MINARAEAEKPSFRRAFADWRCLVPADGFYEWFTTDEVTAKGILVNQPLYIHPDDDGVLPFAGIYEVWHDDTKGSDETAWLTTFAIITTTATDDVGRVHDRMPMTVPADQWSTWLDPGSGVADRPGGPSLRNTPLGEPISVCHDSAAPWSPMT